MSSKSLVSVGIRDLLDAGLHFGHQTKRWNPKMKPFIFDKRNGIHIIDLTQSVKKLDQAAHFLREVTLAGKPILFVATKKQSQEVVRLAAESCGQYFVNQRWLGGMLTNNTTIRRSIQRMRQIEAIARNNNGQLSPHKKEASNLRRELDKLQRNLSGIADMEGHPGAMVVVDVCREAIAIAEANRLKVPVVAIVDTNADPDPVQYPIPGNDDAIRAVKLVVDALAEVIKQAAEEYRQLAAEKTRQIEAERAAAQARKQASEKKAETLDPTQPRLSPEKRKQAAQVARKAVAARAAAADKAPVPAPAPATPSAAPPTEAPTAEEPAAASKPVKETATDTTKSAEAPKPKAAAPAEAPKPKAAAPKEAPKPEAAAPAEAPKPEAAAPTEAPKPEAAAPTA